MAGGGEREVGVGGDRVLGGKGGEPRRDAAQMGRGAGWGACDGGFVADDAVGCVRGSTLRGAVKISRREEGRARALAAELDWACVVFRKHR